MVLLLRGIFDATGLILSAVYRHFYSAYKIPIFLLLLMVAIVQFYSYQFFKEEKEKRDPSVFLG